MKSKINLELKYFCKDFKVIRKILKEIGARKIAIKKQRDYFFNLPQASKAEPARLKLRVENGTQTLIFYQRPNFSKTESTSSDIILYPVKDPDLFSLLQKILGVKVIVEKNRELWKKGNTVFHIDKVKGVGNIFEIEVWTSSKTMRKDPVNFASYKEKFLPYLHKIIHGSNEDLALALLSK